jgi:alkanesulfonate monooxygenase SsuD/methylene tetrahydromethanopterin reductase-like flavin-dependent oxidoreductase (luciferase family)
LGMRRYLNPMIWKRYCAQCSVPSSKGLPPGLRQHGSPPNAAERLRRIARGFNPWNWKPLVGDQSLDAMYESWPPYRARKGAPGLGDQSQRYSSSYSTWCLSSNNLNSSLNVIFR